MTCHEMMDLMQRNLDQDLTAAEERVMLAHLEKCPECSDLNVRLKLLSDELAQLPKVRPAYSIVDAILPQLEGLEGFNNSGLLADSGTAAASDSETAPIMNKVIPLSKKQGFLSWKVFSGVAAAGIVLGMFIFNGGGTDVKEIASEDPLMMKQNIANQSTASAGEQADIFKNDVVNEKEAVEMGSVPLQGDLPTQDTAVTQEKKSINPTKTTPAPKLIPPIRGEVSMAAAPDLNGNYGSAGSGAASVASPSASEGPTTASTSESELPLMDKKGLLSNPTTDASPSTTVAADAGLRKQSGIEEKGAMGMSKIEAPVQDDGKPIAGISGELALTSTTIQPVMSPDGQYTAALIDRSVTVKAKDGSIVFTSAVKMAPGDMITFNGWTENTFFAYSITTADGKVKSYKISASEKKETLQ